MTEILNVLLLLPFYALGAFPSGVLVSKLYGVDITAHGSGNVGATNVARVIGKRAGVVTLAGDILKGCIGVAIASLCSSSPGFVAAAGAAVVCGHCFSIPPFLQGGKGVATAIGVIASLSVYCALIAVSVFFAVFSASRIVSLSSLSAALVVPVAGFVLNLPDATCLSLVVISLVVILRHRENIQRLVEGRESRFELRKPQ